MPGRKRARYTVIERAIAAELYKQQNYQIRIQREHSHPIRDRKWLLKYEHSKMIAGRLIKKLGDKYRPRIIQAAKKKIKSRRVDI